MPVRISLELGVDRFSFHKLLVHVSFRGGNGSISLVKLRLYSGGSCRVDSLRAQGTIIFGAPSEKVKQTRGWHVGPRAPKGWSAPDETPTG